MCGFVGLFTVCPTADDQLRSMVERMTATIRHRGPDDEGHWVAAEHGLALGFRRLSIIDTSEAGHQPMGSPSGRYVMVFNGEVFNYVEIRQELAAAGLPEFRGHSDTEVILAAFDRWGIPAALPRFVGMFAMAVWDRERRELTLIRDRLGIKPLHVYQKDGLVLFGSELKGLMAHPSFDRTLDPVGLGQYFRYLAIPAPTTIFAHARKLLPGTSLAIGRPDAPLPEPRPFWTLLEIAEAGRSAPLPDGPELVDEMERALKQAVRLRMRSDVPVGALLSGGVDSSLVTALMKEETPARVRTFCIGFDRAEHDESRHAAAVAAHLGTVHTEVHLTGKDALDTVPRVAGIFDEPFANPSHIPTLLVCEVARRDVTVALSGDGGDEVFAGYNRYLYGRSVIGRAERWPVAARRAIAGPASLVSAGGWDRGYRAAARVLPGRRERLVGEKVTKLLALMRERDAEGMYRSLMSAWPRPTDVVAADPGPLDPLGVAFRTRPGYDLLARMQLADQLGYLPDDLLAKVDRVSMAVGLEVRVPLIDHNVVALSWRLPASAKIRDGVTKWILREVLYRRVPKELIERPKVGFTVPLVDWLRGPLRAWAEDLLSPDRLGATGLLDVRRVRDQWRAFADGRGELALRMWTVLMFEAWRERWA